MTMKHRCRYHTPLVEANEDPMMTTMKMNLLWGGQQRQRQRRRQHHATTIVVGILSVITACLTPAAFAFVPEYRGAGRLFLDTADEKEWEEKESHLAPLGRVSPPSRQRFGL